MATNLKIGIVIPNKNDSLYLKDCLNSVLDQSVQPDEIIFIDDGSSDNSVQIAKKILKNLINVTIIKNKESVGTMSALNQGIMVSKADYLLFLASNDCLMNGIIAEVNDNLTKHEVSPGIWSALVNVIDESGHVSRIHYSPLISFKPRYFDKASCIKLANKLGNWFTGTTTFYHRESLIKIGGFDSRLGGLGDLFAALQLSAIKGAFFCPKPLGYMRLHGEGLLIKTLKNSTAIDAMLDLIVERGKSNAPLLFNNNFVKKTIARIRFASMREMLKSGNLMLPVSWNSKRINLLRLINGKISNSLVIYLAYLLNRPFDIFYVIYYRAKVFIRASWL
jgi:glycosyltransferase involved in cell wall biosynthesis